MPSVTKDPGFTVYRIRAGDGDHEWATIAIRDWRSTPSPLTGGQSYHCGEILIHSSFGSWGHQWGNMGETVRQFLAGVEFGYLFGKLMGTELRVFDGPGSIDAMVRRVIEARREKRITRDHARYILDSIEDRIYMAADDDSNGFVGAMARVARDFKDEHEGVSGSMDRMTRQAYELLTEPWERVATKDNPQAVGFWRDIWPVFVEALKLEALGASDPLEHVQC